jgi:hypothetical protein
MGVKITLRPLVFDTETARIRVREGEVRQNQSGYAYLMACAKNEEGSLRAFRPISQAQLAGVDCGLHANIAGTRNATHQNRSSTLSAVPWVSLSFSIRPPADSYFATRNLCASSSCSFRSLNTWGRNSRHFAMRLFP